MTSQLDAKHIEMRKTPSGEIVAWDTKANAQFASGFVDEDDYNEWFRWYVNEAKPVSPK